MKKHEIYVLSGLIVVNEAKVLDSWRSNIKIEDSPDHIISYYVKNINKIRR